MSNTICVKCFCRLSYVSFKNEGDKILAFVNNQWQEVEKTKRKNKYGDIVFVIKMLEVAISGKIKTIQEVVV